jgi:uncharacterized membrane protein
LCAFFYFFFGKKYFPGMKVGLLAIFFLKFAIICICSAHAQQELRIKDVDRSVGSVGYFNQEAARVHARGFL